MRKKRLETQTGKGKSKKPSPVWMKARKHEGKAKAGMLLERKTDTENKPVQRTLSIEY